MPTSPRPALARPSQADRPAITAALAAFDQWFLALRRGEFPDPKRGLELARARRAALKSLLASDPRAALAHAIPAGLRGELPAEIVLQLETTVDAFGRLEVVAGCFGSAAGLQRYAEIGDRRLSVHVFGRREGVRSKDRIPLHGIAIDDQFALDERPYRLLGPDADGALAVAIGSDVRSFPSAAALAAWAEQAGTAESAPGPELAAGDNPRAAAPANWTFGEKTVLWLRIDFSDDSGLPASDAEINQTMGRVSAFYQEVSNGRASFKTTLLPGVLRVARTKQEHNADPAADLALRSEAVQLARAYDAANGNAGTYNPDRYDRYVVLGRRLPDLGVGGRASVGAPGVYMNGTLDEAIVAHELGHNHGLQHADGWRPAGSSPIGAGTHTDYGDVFDVMGSALTIPGGHFSSKAKEILLYLDSSHTPAVTTSGTYRVFRHDHRDATGVRALRVAAGLHEYWIEFRQQLPSGPFFSPAERLQNGILILWSRFPRTLEGLGTYLLDATPNSSPGLDPSPGARAGFNDAPLRLGETLTDLDHGLAIRPLARGGTEPNEWMDVRIDFGATGGNRNPTLAADAPRTIVPARTTLPFTAAGTDPDGDPVTIRWNFGDGQPEQTGASVTHRFLRGGTFAVQCSAVDGRGGIATRSFNITVDDPLAAWTRRGLNVTRNALSAVLHDGRQFIAAGSNTILTSPDGVTWTLRRTNLGTNLDSFSDLATDSGRTVTVGTRLQNLSPGTALIEWSADGTTWQSAAFAAEASQFLSVAFGAGRFVAVGTRGTILHSADGRTWSAAASGTSQTLQHVRFGAGRFVAVGLNGTIVSSPDGLAWTNRTALTSANFSRVTYFRDRWIATNGSTTLTSPDGGTWTAQVSTARTIFNSLSNLGDSQVLLAGRAGDILMVSEDGLAWDSFEFPVPSTTGWMAGACLANDILIGVGTEGRIFQTTLRSGATVAPTLAIQPQSQAVPAGGGVTFTVQATGGGLTYEWRRNGTVIPGATGSTYTIAAMTAADAGSYTVTVSNFSGTVTSSAAVLTLDPNTVRIVTMAASRTVAAGTAVTLAVGATGAAPLAYQWLKDGVAVPGATQASLALGLVGPEAAGSYTVVVTDANGSATSVPAVLVVTGELPLAFTTLAGIARSAGSADGGLATAQFTFPSGIAVDRAGVVYVADSTAHTIRRISPDGTVATLAGLAGVTGSADGPGANARFSLPQGLTVDAAGNLYVADTNNNCIRKITPAGVVSTFAALTRIQGAVDGPAATARFTLPHAIASDAAGNLYVSENLANTIRRITPAGVVSTLAGSPRTTGSADGTGVDARFNSPRGLAVDAAGNVYVADALNHTLRRISPAGVVTTLAGQPGTAGSTDGAGNAARFNTPGALAIDAGGNLYVGSSVAVRKITPDRIVTTIGGSPTAGGYVDGLGTAARFATLSGIAVDPLGSLYVSDATNLVVRKGSLIARRGARLANLSVRGAAGTGVDTLIVGFSVEGGAKTVLLRAVGPTLTTLGVGGALANPALRLEQEGALVAQNDDWDAANGSGAAIGAAAATAGAFALPAQSRDAALLETLARGNYTAQVGGGSGVALVEVYDAGGSAGVRLGNVSTRTRAGTGADTLIVGFVVAGDTEKRVLIRGVGPTLGIFGVTGALARPRVTLFRESLLVAENGGWNGAPALAAAFQEAGAFALPAESNDAALLLKLLPGAYTAQLSGAGGETGVALVEIYDLPDSPR